MSTQKEERTGIRSRAQSRSRCTELDAWSCNFQREHAALRQQGSVIAAFRASQAKGWKQTLENIRQLPFLASACLLFLVTLRSTPCLDLHIVCKRVAVLASCNSALETSPACLTCSRISYAASQLIRATPIGLRIPIYISISTRRLGPCYFQ